MQNDATNPPAIVRPAETQDEWMSLANSAAEQGADTLRIAGEALAKARSMCPPGQWEKYLAKKWRYSARYARKLIRLAKRSRQDAEQTVESLSQPIGDEDSCDRHSDADQRNSSSGSSPDRPAQPAQPVHLSTPYVEEPFEIPLDDPPATAPPPPPVSFAPRLRPHKPPGKRTSLDEVKAAISRLARRLTIWMNETPEGQRFAKYVVGQGLNWIDHQDITVHGRTFGKRFVGLRAIRRLVGICAVPGQLSAERVKELWEELDPEGDD